jgi:trimeric autotransporter adhesin
VPNSSFRTGRCVLNKIYSKVWNKSLGMLVVASEFARANGRGSASSRLRSAALAAGIVMALGAVPAMATDAVSKPTDAATVAHLFDAKGATNGSEDAMALGRYSLAAGASSFATGDQSSAFGAYAGAEGLNSTAIGAHSFAFGTDSSALGWSAQATADNATAVGTQSVASGDRSLAVGGAAQALGIESVAVGGGALMLDGTVATAEAKGAGASAFGAGAAASNDFATSLGWNSFAADVQSTAVGSGARSIGIQSTSFGADSDAFGDYATAIGANSSAHGEYTTALGTQSLAVNTDTTALGAASWAQGVNSVAIGARSFSDRANTVSVGALGDERQITNVAEGTETTDAVNKGQLEEVVSGTAQASHLFAADGKVDGSEDAFALGTHSVAVGAGSFAVGDESSAFGAYANAEGLNGTAIGAHSFAYGTGSSALGWMAQAINSYSTAVGYKSSASSDNSVALGANSQADRASTVSVGSAGHERQITNVGAGTQTTDAVNKGQLDTALATVGANMGDLTSNALKYDNSSKKQVTLGGTGGTRISNVQTSGALTDAATVGQLAGVYGALGGGAGLTTNGGMTLPSYAIQGGGYTNVGDALGALNGVLTGAVSNIVSLRNDLTLLQNTPGVAGADPNGGRVVVDGASNGTDTAHVAAGTKGVAIGATATANGNHGTAVGGDSYAAGRNDTALGGNAKVKADGSTAVGANTNIAVTATNAVAVGESASVTAASGTALGQGSSVTSSGAVALGQGSIADRANTVSIGNAGVQRQVTNVAAGTQATDAANYGQIQAALATAKTYADAGDQTTLQSANAYTNQKLGNFASTSDLNTLRNQVNQQFYSVNQRMDRVGAMGAAMSQMSFSTQGINTPDRLGMGVGGYNGQAALSLGYAHQITPKANLTFGAALSSGGESSGGVGLGVGW